MTHPGSKENPIEVVAPGDLDRATLRNWDPTPAQAAAGNYRKTHAIVAGLPIAIETPLDRMRRGVGPDGTPWAVRMPAHYGDVKRSEGADGDGIDVYVGPEAHRARELPVFVIDQVDAETGEFDEHKCCIGFATGRDALRVYESAFSDGKGRLRVGAVTNMSFAAFRTWLDSGDTIAALSAKAVSALGCGCGATQSACRCQTGGSEDSMTTVQPDANPNGFGFLTKAFTKVLGRLTPAERTDFLKDAAVQASLELGKATDLLENPGTHRAEDLWDGPQDDHLETVHAQGPDSSVAPGKVNTGTSQDASGGGANRMEDEYSRHARQVGVQRATEELGRKLASHTRAMKSFAAFGKAVQHQIEALQSTSSLAQAAPDDAAIKAAVAAALPGAVALALAKAIPEVVRTVVKAKKAAESEKDDDKEGESGEEDEEEEEDDDEEADQAESGSGTEIEIVNELEEEDEAEAESDEDETKKAARKAAAAERRIAKSLIRLAKAEAEEAEDAMADGRHHAGKRHHRKAKHRMHKARLHLSIAKSLNGGAGKSSVAIGKSIEAVGKALKKTRAENQDKWPEGPKHDGKEHKAEHEVGKATPTADEMAKANAALQKALSGMALLQADVQQVMQMVGGQPRNPTAEGGPPINELYKADLALVGGQESAINQLAAGGHITMAQRDKAIDAIATLRQPSMPQGMIDATINACPPVVQAILRKAA